MRGVRAIWERFNVHGSGNLPLPNVFTNVCGADDIASQQLRVLFVCARFVPFGRAGKPAGFRIQTKRAQSDRLLYADAEKLLHFESDPAKVRTITAAACSERLSEKHAFRSIGHEYSCWKNHYPKLVKKMCCEHARRVSSGLLSLRD